jgi:hypothetical protein
MDTEIAVAVAAMTTAMTVERKNPSRMMVSRATEELGE